MAAAHGFGSGFLLPDEAEGKRLTKKGSSTPRKPTCPMCQRRHLGPLRLQIGRSSSGHLLPGPGKDSNKGRLLPHPRGGLFKVILPLPWPRVPHEIGVPPARPGAHASAEGRHTAEATLTSAIQCGHKRRQIPIVPRGTFLRIPRLL